MRATLPERCHELAVPYLSERPYQSGLTRSNLRHEEQAGSNLPKRRADVAPNTQSDLPERRAEVAALQLFGRTYD
ncbi:hypothetical protein F2Q69_00021157 [Brassica cretica]|uniref:Uncharacterized protein n=1 Tax=Brassica cretica TaxID=69181 RepID=A0A8S9QGT6_BRACR|nr:hypothetical protein F2Q69_00021157 [Brassica cretica]